MNKYCYNANISMHEFKRTFYYNNVEVLTLSIKYPEISLKYNPQVEYLINNQINMNVNEFVRYAKYMYDQAVKGYNNSQINDYPFHSYSAYMEYTITYNENCFLSLYIDKYEFTGGAHGSTVRSSDTWELCNGTHLPLSSFFEPNVDYRRLMIDEITKQAEYNSQQNSNIYFDEYKSLIIRNFDENSFYLTPLGITIYYQQYDIAPYSTGIVEFTIPYAMTNWHPNC